ncbi:hypothetical protein BH11BAC3_BH11BAC3_38150 [soil metagenome]
MRMRQLVNIMLVLFVMSCNNNAASNSKVDADSTGTKVAPAQNIEYAYMLPEPYEDWQPGNKIHAANVMNSLKAYENGDIDACIAAFGDTVVLRFDGYRNRVSKDSLKTIFSNSRAQLASEKIYMDDWESVVSKDGKTEYVTLWYKQVTTTKKGVTDSLTMVDDLKIEEGKIVAIDQKIQHYPMGKK